MSDIFISYKREDQPIARQLAVALEKEGWSVWWDPKLRAGDHFDDVIEKALNKAKCVIVLWSAGSLQSRYVRDEATFALERNKLVPIAIENVELPFRFSSVHTPRLLKWNGSREYADYHRLVEDIAGLIGRPVMRVAENVGATEEKKPFTQTSRSSAGTSSTIGAEIAHHTDEVINREGAQIHMTGQIGAQRDEGIATASRDGVRSMFFKQSSIIGLSVVGLVVLIPLVGWWLFRGKETVDLPTPPPPPPAYTVPEPKKSSERTEAPAASSPPVEPEVVVTPGKFLRDRLKIGGEGPEMIVLPAGSFQMGDQQAKGGKDEIPVHSVQLNKPFALSRFEVTFAEYDAFAKATKGKLPEDQGWGRGRRPVINVSWEDVQGYTRWLSEQTGKRYRLPSEAEWEYAARAGTNSAYWWGENIGKGQANCNGCGSQWDNKQTGPVGSFKANGFGVFDTAGNVWEWVEDCGHENYNGAPTDGRAWKEENGGQCGRRVLRGGSWNFLPEFLRSSFRFRGTADYWYTSIGFRLAQDLD